MNKKRFFFYSYALPFLLVLVTAITYFGSLSHQFVWDDLPLITENSQLRKLDNIPSFFLPHYWKYEHPGTKGQYRPLRAVSMALSYQLWKLRPFGYHLTNLILHILNALLVYLVMVKLFGKGNVAFLTSLLFALHPIHTESVSWLKNRTDLMALIFFLLSISAYISYVPVCRDTSRENKQPLWLIASCLFFILALMGKETAIILPIILIFYLFYFHPYPYNKSQVPTILPFCAIAAFYLVFCFVIINKGLPTDPDEISLPFSPHLSLIIQTVSSYVSMIFLPIHLNAERLMDIPTSPLNSSLLFSLGVLMLIALVWMGRLLPPRKEGFAVAWFFTTLLPVINLKLMSGRPLAEQRLYIPSVGFCLLIALILNQWLPSKLHSRCTRLPRVVILLTLSLVTCYAILTWERDKVWHNNLTLWKDTVAKSPQTFRTHFNMGSAYTEKGDYQSAIAEFEESIRLNPKDHESFTSLGAAYYRKGDLEKAKENFVKAIALFEDSYRAHNNLANVYTVLGKTDAALKEYQEAIKIKPNFAEAYFNMGNAYKERGDLNTAIGAYAKAIGFEPDFSQSHYNLGNCYLLIGEKTKAEEQFRKALESDATLIGARYNLANLFYGRKEYPNAIHQLQIILRYDPQHAESHYVLGSIYSETGNLEAALEEYKAVVRISPNNAEARNSLGKTYMLMGQGEKGRMELSKALELDPHNGYVHYNIGKFHVSEGDFGSATKEFEKALVLNPDISEAWYNLGVILHKQGNDKAAIEKLNKAAEVNPGYFDALFQLGNLYSKQKQCELAVKSFERAISVQPNSAEVHLKLGILYLSNFNDKSNALLHLREALRLNPHYPHASKIKEALALLE